MTPSANLSVDGILDTNLFIHALARDEHSIECAEFLRHVADGRVTAWLDPLVLHETTYAMPRVHRSLTRDDIAVYLVSVLSWKGVVGQIELMRLAVEAWRFNPGVSFVDAYLAMLARRDEVAIFTKNARDFDRLGSTAPDPLPGARSSNPPRSPT